MRVRALTTSPVRRAVALAGDADVDAGNPTGTTALYERVGMRVARAWTV